MPKNSTNYCTKEDLYRYVNDLKKCMNIDSMKIGIDIYWACQRINGIKMEVVDFSDRSLRGMAVPKDNIILLNSSRNEIERNFDCAHEFIHVVRHKHEDTQTFSCLDKLCPRQNPFLEWQANEGAAEILVPYKVFIPIFCEYHPRCENEYEYYYLLDYLAHLFNVPLRVIELRIENLKYEIYQYEKGCDIDSIQVLSNKKQEQKGIHIVSYNVKYDFCQSII